MLEKSGNYSFDEVSQAAELYPSLWIEKHNIKTSNGLPFEFDNHRFMIDVLNDMSQFQVGLKPPQVGWSESMIIKSLYVADKKEKDIIYTLPTATDRDDMVNSKVNRIIAQNPVLKAMVKDHDTVEQKSVGNHLIHYRGTFAAKQAMMISSDLNIHDETDASDPSVITQYETRLAANPNGMRWYFSHPSLAGHGVDVYWQQSNKREWHITCKSCKEEQILTWPDNIDIQRRKYVCSLCKSELSDDDRRDGIWKATAQGEFSGYHISQMMCPWITASKIVDAYNDPQKDKQYFYNYVLGLPYVGSEDKIEPSIILKNCVDEVNEQEGRIIIGMDTGHGIHFTLMNKQGVFFYGNANEITASKDPYDTIRGFLKRWPRSIVISDQGGDLIGIRKLQAEFPGRVFLCFYRKDRKSVDLVDWGENEEYGKVTVDRNRMITLMVEQLRDIGRVRIQGTPEEWREWASQFGNLYREKVLVKETKDKDSRDLYGNEYVWKRNGPDHYAHSLLYAIVGFQRYGGGMAKIVGESMLDGIPKGVMVESQDVHSFVSPEAFRENTLEI